MANADIGCQQSLQWMSVMASTDLHESALAPEPSILPDYFARLFAPTICPGYLRRLFAPSGAHLTLASGFVAGGPLAGLLGRFLFGLAFGVRQHADVVVRRSVGRHNVILFSFFSLAGRQSPIAVLFRRAQPPQRNIASRPGAQSNENRLSKLSRPKRKGPNWRPARRERRESCERVRKNKRHGAHRPTDRWKYSTSPRRGVVPFWRRSLDFTVIRAVCTVARARRVLYPPRLPRELERTGSLLLARFEQRRVWLCWISGRARAAEVWDHGWRGLHRSAIRGICVIRGTQIISRQNVSAIRAASPFCFRQG